MKIYIIQRTLYIQSKKKYKEVEDEGSMDLKSWKEMPGDPTTRTACGIFTSDCCSWDLALLLNSSIEWIESDQVRYLAYLVLDRRCFPHLLGRQALHHRTQAGTGEIRPERRKRRKLHLALILGGFTLVTVILVILTATRVGTTMHPCPKVCPFTFRGVVRWGGDRHHCLVQRLPARVLHRRDLRALLWAGRIFE